MIIKRCMGLPVCEPEAVRCLQCTRLVHSYDEEMDTEAWVENPSAPCQEYREKPIPRTGRV